MPGPPIRRRQLGAALRQLRLDHGDTREQVAAVLGCSPTKVTYMEAGRNAPSKTDLIVLLDYYGASDRLATLEGLRAEAGKRGWWSTARLPEWLATYTALENEAASVRCFELELIPGLLQHADYARAVHVLRGYANPEDLQRRVDARLRRQQRLTAPDPLELSAVISQAALTRTAADPQVAAASLAHLLAAAKLPNVDIRILPFAAGLHSGLQGAFTLLSFPQGLLPDAAWQEYALGGHVIDDAADVAALTRLYGEIRGQALGCDESLAMIADLAASTR
jgi:transcriptional regulator with XRE-family HTH domain